MCLKLRLGKKLFDHLSGPIVLKIVVTCAIGHWNCWTETTPQTSSSLATSISRWKNQAWLGIKIIKWWGPNHFVTCTKKQMKFLPTRSHCWNQCPWRSRKLERCCPISSVISYQVKRTRIILFKEARLHFLGENLPVQSVRDLWVGISNVDHNVTNSVHLWPIYQFEIKGKVYWDWDWNWGVRTFKLNAWGSEADVVTANCKKCKNWK